MTVCFRMPPVAIPWKLRDLHTSILSNNLHSGEINKYFWKFCLHLLMSKFYHWLVFYGFYHDPKILLELMETTPSLLLSEKLSSHASDHGWVTRQGIAKLFPWQLQLVWPFFFARQMRVCYRITSLLRDPSTSENLLSCWYAVNM